MFYLDKKLAKYGHWEKETRPSILSSIAGELYQAFEKNNGVLEVA